MTKAKVLLSKRAYLNPKDHSDNGLIQSKVSVDDYNIDGSVSIWDCSRKITLDFDVHNHKDAAIRAKKLDIIIDHLQEVKKAMGEAYTIATEASTLDKRYDTETSALDERYDDED